MQVPKSLVVGAMALGIAGGSYGIASAATGNTTTTAPSTAATAPATAPSSQQPFGHQRSDETVLTGDALAKVTAAAEARSRVERSSGSRPTRTDMRSTRRT